MISQEVIDRILDRADIVDIVRETVNLRKAGTDYVACCPFHAEKTPSFHVSPSRQTWHCFGQCNEGGNVIKFVMKRDGITFPDAIKKLANRYGIEIEQEKEGAEERQRRLKREAMVGLNERVSEFYRSLLYSSAPDSISAKSYAEKRFGIEYVKEMGIGYAPSSWHALSDWARGHSESMELLIELGLLKRNEENGNIYDFLRSRLVIPIRDRRGSVIGFTARSLSDDASAKYVNSAESEVYHKSQTVFGLNEAWKQAAKEGKMYLVEGAPDAMKMHSVGINNVVAALGGNWTKDQFLLLKKIVATVCFINDADPVPQGKKYGTGISYVLKNGELAMQHGLSVTVKELPCKDGNLKQDPGDFFTQSSKIKELKEEDFVTWFASKVADKDMTSVQLSEAFQRIANVASYITDDTITEMLLDGLNKIRRGREFWRNIIQKAKWSRDKADKRSNGEIDLREYGFVAENGCYVGQTDKGGEATWSNFTMKPIFHIKDTDNPKRIFYVKNNRGAEEVVEMDIEDLVSLSRFRQKLEGIGNSSFGFSMTS